MAKVLPVTPAPASSSPSPSSAHQRQVLLPRQRRQAPAAYTVWMKSLLFNGNGCTVYGADGDVAFRVDNYGCKGGAGRQVFFMDCAGRTLIRIQRKGFGVFRRWEACRCFDNDGEGDLGAAESTSTVRAPWFEVKKAAWKNAATVTVRGGSGIRTSSYTVDGCVRESEYRICGADGAVVAAVGRKRTTSGVVLGEDVLTLTVGSEVDHLLVLGIVVVCGLMNRCLRRRETATLDGCFSKQKRL